MYNFNFIPFLLICVIVHSARVIDSISSVDGHNLFFALFRAVINATSLVEPCCHTQCITCITVTVRVNLSKYI